MMEIEFAGQTLRLDGRGGIFWPDEQLLLVSDLHLEKGSFLVQFGSLLPRHDTQDTLLRLQHLIDQYQPRQVVCLGDSFHDQRAWSRFPERDRQLLWSLVESVNEWYWILGNHDVVLPPDLPGMQATSLERRGIRLVHEPMENKEPQIIGHYHPKLSVTMGGARINSKAFAQDNQLLVMPAFGTYTGGLDLSHPVFATLLTLPRYYLLYRERIWRV
jgi:DNA ligase-associated metallophosphoesterase